MLPEPRKPGKAHYRNLVAQNEWIHSNLFDGLGNYRYCQACTVQVIKKCPDVLSVLLSTDSTTVRSTVSTMVHSTVSTTVHSTVSTTVHSTVSTNARYASKKVSGKVHGRDGEASCPTRTTQRFYRPMPLLSLYLVLSLSSSSFSLDRQLCADTRVYVGRAQSTVEVHGRDGEASCSTRTTTCTQRFYRPMPLLSLYLVLSLSSSSFSLDRQLTSHVLGVLYAVLYPYLVVRMRMYA